MTARPYSGRHRAAAPCAPPLRQATRSVRSLSGAAVALLATATGAAVLVSAAGEDGTVDRSLSPVSSSAAMEAEHGDQHVEARNQVALKVSAAQTRVEATRQVARDRQRRALTLKKRAALAQRAALARRAQTQRVAQAKAELQSRRDWTSPITGGVFTSGFGFRWGRMHQGDDLAAPVGTPLLAMSEGVVISAGYEGGYGNKVEVRYWDGTVSVYAHMDSIDVAVGQQVGSGVRVGASGNTGRSTGPHLHLEIHPDGGEAVDPSVWLSAKGVQA